MKIKVEVYLDGKKINPANYSKLVITSPAVDRIVNDIVDKATQSDQQVA